MHLVEAVDTIHERIMEHRLAKRANLWSTILKQIRKQDSFDGAYVHTILEIIRAFLKQLDDATAITLWRQTETGMGDETEDECLFASCVRAELEMEFLQEITNLAWQEAKQRT